MESHVRIETDGPVWTVIIDRPEVRNAVDRQTAQELAEALRLFDAQPSASVAVLWGAGGNFCAGADLKAFADSRGNRLEPEGDAPMGPSRMVLSKPVIAAVSGFAVAGGLELAAWCDLRVVEQTATLGVFCRRWGVPLIDGGTVRLPQIVGLGVAMDLILTGRPVEAGEALRIGLANRIVPEGQARSAAEVLARELADLPQTCMRNDRTSAYASMGQTTQSAMAVEWQLGQQSLREGAAQGAARFAAGDGRHGQATT
ncbi:MAG: crotonase/enoyl-CoA hydratase family protein [Candidatus Nanopelagicales bacterium]